MAVKRFTRAFRRMDRKESPMNRRVLVTLACCLSLTALLVALGGCESKRKTMSPAPRGAVILGIDALDWQVLEPLLAAGEAPTFARLRDQSASGVCLSFIPLEKSPLIWASIATGLEPAQHGVGGFVKQRGHEDYDVLTSAADWRAPALWDIAAAADLTSCVIGWWVTFPARDLRGVMVSDHVSFTEAGNRNPEGLVRPNGLTEELAALTIDYRDVPVELLQALAPNADPDELADPSHRDWTKLRLALAGDLTYLATAKRLLAQGTYDLFAVYFRGLDLVCHAYWRYYQPGDGTPPAAADRERLGTVIPGYYRVLDRWLAELLPLLPDAANVIVVSDHGFYGPRRDRAGNMQKGVAEHRAEGVLIVRSASYEPGTRFDRTFVLNVAPTALALLGLPPSREMPGRILRDGLTPAGLAFVESLEANRLASYAALAPQPPAAVADDPAVDEAIRRQLRSLGYVD